MLIKDFVEKYNASEDKESFIREHIIKDYVGYLNKISMCDRVIQASCYKDVDGVRKFYMNRPAQFMLFVMTIIYEYTNVEGGASVIADFDYLDQHGLIDIIIELIPDGEYETLQAILEMMISDVMENEHNIVSYIDSKIDALGMSMEALGEALGEMFDGEDIGEE